MRPVPAKSASFNSRPPPWVAAASTRAAARTIADSCSGVSLSSDMGAGCVSILDMVRLTGLGEEEADADEEDVLADSRDADEIESNAGAPGCMPYSRFGRTSNSL